MNDVVLVSLLLTLSRLFLLLTQLNVHCKLLLLRYFSCLGYIYLHVQQNRLSTKPHRNRWRWWWWWGCGLGAITPSIWFYLMIFTSLCSGVSMDDFTISPQTVIYCDTYNLIYCEKIWEICENGFHISLISTTVKRKRHSTILHWIKTQLGSWQKTELCIRDSCNIPEFLPTTTIITSRKVLIYPSSWFFISLIIIFRIKFTVQLRVHSLIRT